MIEFIGMLLERANEIKDLITCFEKNAIVCMTGEMGIGKTNLAEQFIKVMDLPDFRKKFEKVVFFTAELKDNWESIVNRLIRKLQADFTQKSNSKELEAKIIEHISQYKICLVLDNVNNEEIIPDIIGFIGKWSKQVHNGSKLLLTLRELPFNDRHPLPEKCCEFPLKGISKDESIKRILGENLFQFIENSGLKDELKKLNGNPMKLGQLRMCMPEEPELEDSEKLKRYIKEIQVLKDEDTAKKNVIKTILMFIKSDNKNVPLDHFLALGRIRALKFDEALVPFLWENLGCGNTQLYGRTLESLIRDGLLEQVPREKQKIRLNAFTRMMLEKYCIEYFGKERLPLIDYFISEYYRNSFSESKKEAPELEELNHFVYHALRSGNYDSAYSYVFESAILNSAHNSGLAVGLKPILSHFYNYWNINFIKDKDLDGEKNLRLVEQWVMIQMEAARIYKDLSEHEKSLGYLSEAKNSLENKIAEMDKNQTDQRVKRKLGQLKEIRRKIWHLLGVAYSQVGKTEECLNAYKTAVESAAEQKSFTSIDALSMGYLAYELKFHDIDMAEKVGEAAVNLCGKIKDPEIKSVTTKNLCSLAQIKAFKQNANDSIKYFNEAFARCDKPPQNKPGEITKDSRELGRILINSAVIYIYMEDWKEVEARLKYASAVYEKSGDKRRKSMGDAYFGIMLYRQGKCDEGKGKILDAFQKHKEIKAQREMIYEALTYIWMVAPNQVDGLIRTISQKNKIVSEDDLNFIKTSNIPENIYKCIIFAINTESKIFIKFWENHYKTTLLIKASSENVEAQQKRIKYEKNRAVS